jgi:hypothetical protein
VAGGHPADRHGRPKDGGFMGFGAEQMSAGKQPMLDQLPAALGGT